MGIKAEDLRRGNLLIFDGRIVKVSVIGSDYLGVKDGHKISSLDYSWLKPIPITEEWLIRLPEDLVSEDIPSWVKFVHHLQNWYWVEKKCEKELVFK